jgi:hypothetical protein
MDKPLLVLAAIYALGLVYVVLPVVMEAWLRYRKSRQVTCPEEKIAAAINIDARAAAVAAAKGKTRLQIRDCSLWPEKSGCGQHCLAQAA